MTFTSANAIGSIDKFVSSELDAFGESSRIFRRAQSSDREPGVFAQPGRISYLLPANSNTAAVMAVTPVLMVVSGTGW